MMKAGSMEGLIGASQNMKMVDVPMRIYREAERKGDMATMERAMGYAGEFAQKADDYKEKAQNELIKELREERQELEEKKKERLEEKREENKDIKTEHEGIEIEISEDGQVLSKDSPERQQKTSVVKVDDMKGYDPNGEFSPDTSKNTISVRI